jgi:hypothetical protein
LRAACLGVLWRCSARRAPRVCRWSRGRRPSGSDGEEGDRRGTSSTTPERGQRSVDSDSATTALADFKGHSHASSFALAAGTRFAVDFLDLRPRRSQSRERVRYSSGGSRGPTWLALISTAPRHWAFRRRRASIAGDSRRPTPSRLSSPRLRAMSSRLMLVIVLNLPSLVGFARQEEGQVRLAIRHEGRRCREPLGRRPVEIVHRPRSRSQWPSLPASRRRRVVGGCRAWAEDTGRRASALPDSTPIERARASDPRA